MQQSFVELFDFSFWYKCQTTVEELMFSSSETYGATWAHFNNGPQLQNDVYDPPHLQGSHLS